MHKLIKAYINLKKYVGSIGKQNGVRYLMDTWRYLNLNVGKISIEVNITHPNIFVHDLFYLIIDFVCREVSVWSKCGMGDIFPQYFVIVMLCETETLCAGS